MTVTEVTALIASRVASMHIYAQRPGAFFSVVKLLPQTTGGVDVQTPDGRRQHCATAQDVVTLTHRLLTPRPAPSRPVKFAPRHLDGLHVHFTTDQDQCLVVWRTHDPDDRREIVTVRATIWAAATEGEIEGYDLSPRQRGWLERLVEIANLWADDLTQKGLNGNTGGIPTSPVRQQVPVRTRRGKQWRTVR